MVIMAVLAVLKLGTEFVRLTLSTEVSGAVDLGLRYQEVQLWFSGAPIYGVFPWIAYPPQAYPFLWLLLGWLGLTPARWLWAATSIVALAWLTHILVRASGATTRQDRLLIALTVLSMNAVGVTIGNGQLILHLLPALLASMLLIAKPRRSLRDDVLAAGLLIVAMVKPTLTAPFIWVAVALGGWRALAAAGAGYVACTWFAASFQPAPILPLMSAWLAQSRAEIGGGYGDVQSALVNFGAVRLASIAPLLILAAHAVWTWRYRRADVWIQLGVAALVARLFAYHRVYDDALILVPMVALFRMASGGTSERRRWAAGVSFVIAVVAMLAPARLELAAPPLNWLFIGGHVIVWLIMLMLLIVEAGAERQSDLLVESRRGHATA